MRIIQICDGYRTGDGVSNVVASVDEILRANGIETYMITRQLTDGDIYGGTFSEDDIVLYSAGTIMDPKVKKIKCKKILFFHNITPPELCEDADGETGIFTAAGLHQVRMSKDIFDHVLTSSEYSKECLLEAGWDEDKIFVLPIRVRFDQFRIEPKEDIVKALSNKKNIIFTGRVYPNKKHEDLIRAFSVYKKKYNNESRLIIVGGLSSRGYYECLKQYAESLGVADDVVFTGHVDMDEYVAYYKAADLFLCMSEHEGFCIPLVEAMHFRVPVLAYKSTAVPGTLGGGGVLFDRKDFDDVARQMDELMRDQRLREKVLCAQDKRLKELSAMSLEKDYMDVFSRIIGSFEGEKLEKKEEPGFCFKEDVFSELKSPITDRIMIYGAGAAGRKLYSALNYQFPDAKKIFCDKGRANETEEEFGVKIISPDEAMAEYSDWNYIITLQNKHLLKEIMFMLISGGIPMDNIYIYEKYINKVL